MATLVLADEELEWLRRFPEINREELISFFTLTSADVAFMDPGRGRGHNGGHGQGAGHGEPDPSSASGAEQP